MTSMTSRLSLLLVVVAGCSFGWIDNPSGGDDNLPTLGAGPFGKPTISFDTPADEPYILSDSSASLLEPTALDRDDGGFRLWYGRHPDDTTDGEIWTVEIPDVTELPDVAPAPVLTADQDWEQGRITAPAVAMRADGQFVMLYEGGVDQPSLGMAESPDGVSWTKSLNNPVVANAAAPALAVDDDGQWIAFLVRPGEPNIYRAASADGQTWAVADAPVLEPQPGVADAFDSVRVFAPSVVIRRSATGRTLYGLHYNGENIDGAFAIGFAASTDGVAWTRFSDVEPVLDGGNPDEFGPSVVPRSTSSFLFFTEERQLRQRIAVAVHP